MCCWGGWEQAPLGGVLQKGLRKGRARGQVCGRRAGRALRAGRRAPDAAGFAVAGADRGQGGGRSDSGWEASGLVSLEAEEGREGRGGGGACTTSRRGVLAGMTLVALVGRLTRVSLAEEEEAEGAWADGAAVAAEDNDSGGAPAVGRGSEGFREGPGGAMEMSEGARDVGLVHEVSEVEDVAERGLSRTTEVAVGEAHGSGQDGGDVVGDSVSVERAEELLGGRLGGGQVPAGKAGAAASTSSPAAGVGAAQTQEVNLALASPAAAAAAPGLLRSLLAGVGAAGAAGSTAEVFTLPFDTMKVRMQLNRREDGVPAESFVEAIAGITGGTAAGAPALWNGLTPALHHQCLYGALRLVMYDPIKSSLASILVGPGEGSGGLEIKLLAALLSGIAAVSVANPTDVLKVRAQAKTLPPGALRRALGFSAYAEIARQDGIASLWSGLGPNMARHGISTMSELAVYDQINSSLISAHVMGATGAHVASAFAAGVASALMTSPIDIVKARKMTQTPAPLADREIFSAPQLFDEDLLPREGPTCNIECSPTTCAHTAPGVVDIFTEIVTEKGVAGLYAGIGPCMLRLTSWNVIMFLTYESIKDAFGIR